ncbi:hypothetical protein PVK06_035256 [Gossypium arboreum]|uniref:Uncharacterized protein n=1 Tax=Gossypium arboreum TaxID=29729 RepID=A0ABR0NGD1_GOSAR|nr:hypothetical protein PVK06_035256 [Gossypium arboreum]
MDSEGKQDRVELSASLGRVSVQKSEVERTSEILQARCVDCGKKRDHSPPSTIRNVIREVAGKRQEHGFDTGPLSIRSGSVLEDFETVSGWVCWSGGWLCVSLPLGSGFELRIGRGFGIVLSKYKINVDSEGKQDHVKSSAYLGRVPVQEFEVSVISLTLGSDNPDLGTEALTRLVREVLEEVFEARVERTGEMLQTRCVDCGKKRDRSPPRLKPRSTKRLRTSLSGKNSFAEGVGSGTGAPFCEHCKKCHPGNCWKKGGHVFDADSQSIESETGMVVNVLTFWLVHYNCV